MNNKMGGNLKQNNWS